MNGTFPAHTVVTRRAKASDLTRQCVRGRKLNLCVDVANTVLDQINVMGIDNRERVAQSWGTEFGADRIALELSVQAEPNSEFKVFQVYAAEWFFLMCHILQVSEGKISGEDFAVSDTHPPHELRLEHLRVLANADARPHDLGASLKKLVDEIVNAL